jgi:mono/diheme cytochrome c family protein
MRRWLRFGPALPLLLCFGCHTPSAENGALLYHNNCLVCHSLKPGERGYGPSLAGYFARNPTPTVADTRQVILDGRKLMPPFHSRLTSAQIDDVIAYLKIR